MTTSNGNGHVGREPIRITPAHDPDLQVVFEIPIKGRKALTFSVPRLQYLDRQVVDQLDTWTIDRNQAIDDNTLEAKRFRKYDGTLFLLERLLPAEKFSAVEQLTVGELLQIDGEWEKASNIAVGKSSVSPVS